MVAETELAAAGRSIKNGKCRQLADTRGMPELHDLVCKGLRAKDG